MKKNDLSLIICAYKDSPFLEECINSLVNQDVKCPIAISTSTPSNYISRIAEKYNIPLYINRKCDGYYNDFLFAYKKAKTRFVTLCHQDDIYMHNFTAEVLKKIERNNKILITFSNYYDYKNNKIIKISGLLIIKRILNFLLRFRVFQGMKVIRKRILSFGNPICSPTVTFNKELVKEPVAKCPFRTSHDWYTWVLLSNDEGKFIYISKPILLRRINEFSETTLVIENNTKKASDYEVFKMLWPEWIAKIISKVYSVSEKNNRLKEKKKNK